MGATGAVLVGAGMTASGLIVALIGCLSLGLGRVLASLRDETGLARAQTLATAIVPAAATAALGWTLDAPLALASAVALLYLGAIGERAVQRPRRRGWWGSPPAYLLLLTIGALAGSGMAGLLAATLYAAATLAAAVESTRPEA